MRTCPKCSEHYEDEFAFCPLDGTPLIEVVAPELPLVAGEVIGWRAWEVDTLGKIVRLGSVTHHGIWPVGDWVYAECGGERSCWRSPDHRVPGSNCTCGLYAAKTFEQLTIHLPYAYYSDSDKPKVIGEVAMAGKIIEGTQGWKAEKARVYKLYVPHTHWKLGKRIAEAYNVEYELLRWIG